MSQLGTPTEYGGVVMRSRTEAMFARAMDAFGIAWTYEPRVFAGEDGRYRWLADFELGLARPTYAEVKDRLGDGRESGLGHREWQALVRRKIECAWIEDPSLDLYLAERGERLRERPEGVPPMGFVGRSGKWYRGGLGRCTCGAYVLLALGDETPCGECGRFDDRSYFVWPFRTQPE